MGRDAEQARAAAKPSVGAYSSQVPAPVVRSAPVPIDPLASTAPPTHRAPGVMPAQPIARPDYRVEPAFSPVMAPPPTTNPMMANAATGFGHAAAGPLPLTPPAQPLDVRGPGDAGDGRWTTSRPPPDGQPGYQPQAAHVPAKKSSTPFLAIGLVLLVLLGGGAAFLAVKLLLH